MQGVCGDTPSRPSPWQEREQTQPILNLLLPLQRGRAGGVWQATTLFQQRLRFCDNVIDSKAELFEQLFCRSRFAEAGHADYAAVEANVLVPVIRNTGLHCQSRRDV